MNLKDIEKLIGMVTKSDVTELSYKQNDEKIIIRRGGHSHQSEGQPVYVHHTPAAAQPVAAPAPTPTAAETKPAEAEAKPDAKSNLHTIKAPLVGTLYRSPAPDAPPYVKVGDVVTKGQVLCIIEAMKLMNEIEADIDGKVVQIFVENANPVEYGADILVIEPS